MLTQAAHAADAPALRLPPFKDVTLRNGLRLLVAERRNVPLVSLELWIEAGAALDPPGKEGLASLTADALRKGAGSHDAAAFAEALDFLGANLSTTVDHVNAVLQLELLSKDFDAGLALLGDAVVRPQLPADEIAKLAAQMADAVVQAKDNPRLMINEYFRAFLYGDHPLGNPVNGTEHGAASITRADAERFYRAHYGSDRAILAVVGDVRADEVAAKVEAAFAALPRATAVRLALEPPARPDRSRVLLVNKPDTPQTWFQIGGLGPAWGDPDYAASEVVRTVLGGRFTSWLNTALRIESGLTYGATWGVLRSKVAGPSRLSSFTATEHTQQAIDLALAQLARLHRDGIDEPALAAAKSYLKGQLPYDYETGRDLASALCLTSYYGLGRQFVDGLFAGIDAVDTAACRVAIARDFPVEKLVFATIGVADKVREVLARYGEVTVRENAAEGFR